MLFCKTNSGVKVMFPKDPSDTNINANQSGVLEVMEYFLKQKLRSPEQEENKKQNNYQKQPDHGGK